MRRFGSYVTLALSIACVGSAYAQDNGIAPAPDAPMTEPAAMEPTMDASAAMMGGAYPTEEVLRPINLRSGMVELGAEMGVFKQPDFADAIGLILRADYGLSDQLQVGLRVPLALAKPDGLEQETLGGFWLNGLYGFHENISARLDLGFAYPGQPYALVPFVTPTFFDGDGMKLAFRLGVTLKKAFTDQLALVADPGIFFHLDGQGDETTQILMVPVSLWYQLMPELALALNTGVLSGHKFKFSGDEEMFVPLYLTAQFTTVENHLDLGLNVGFANLTVPGQADVGDSLFLGLYANYRL